MNVRMQVRFTLHAMPVVMENHVSILTFIA